MFGAWSSWTDDYDEYAAQPEIFNYCANTPMMFAFVILLLKWVRYDDKLKQILQIQSLTCVDPDPTNVCDCFLLWVSWGLLLLPVFSSF